MKKKKKKDNHSSPNMHPTGIEPMIETHPGLEIAQSREGKDSGTGVFIDKVYASQPCELMRIPKDLALSLPSCQDLLESLPEESQKIVKKCLSHIVSLTETNILVNYVIGFVIVRRTSAWPHKHLDSYLDTLLSTKVENIHSDSVEAIKRFAQTSLAKENVLFQAYYQDLLFASDNYNRLMEDLPLSAFSLAEFIQLNNAIKSRILEIPSRIDESEDYSTDISLVPLLDFVNHSTDEVKANNAHFNVDKVTGDILLLFDPAPHYTAVVENDLVEVLIKYSEVEDVHRFFFNYGFIPTSANSAKILHVSVDGSRVQFVLYYSEEGCLEDVVLNMDDNFDFLEPHSRADPYEAIGNLQEEQIDCLMGNYIKSLMEHLEIQIKELEKVDLIGYNIDRLKQVYLSVFEKICAKAQECKDDDVFQLVHQNPDPIWKTYASLRDCT